MTNYIALLRAVNVGGTGKLPMSDLVAICKDLGFDNVKTYIASGNVVFSSSKEALIITQELETKLEAYAGKPVGVIVRTASEMQQVFANNPFADKEPKFTVAIFLDGDVSQDTLNNITGKQGEECILGKREIYVHYDKGMGRSKLKIPAAKHGTARNMNTIAKLATMAAEHAKG